jgi:hypothetical protein
VLQAEAYTWGFVKRSLEGSSSVVVLQREDSRTVALLLSDDRVFLGRMLKKP